MTESYLKLPIFNEFDNEQVIGEVLIDSKFINPYCELVLSPGCRIGKEDNTLICFGLIHESNFAEYLKQKEKNGSKF